MGDHFLHGAGANSQMGEPPIRICIVLHEGIKVLLPIMKLIQQLINVLSHNP